MIIAINEQRYLFLFCPGHIRKNIHIFFFNDLRDVGKARVRLILVLHRNNDLKSLDLGFVRQKCLFNFSQLMSSSLQQHTKLKYIIHAHKYAKWSSIWTRTSEKFFLSILHIAIAHISPKISQKCLKSKHSAVRNAVCACVKMCLSGISSLTRSSIATKLVNWDRMENSLLSSMM